MPLSSSLREEFKRVLLDSGVTREAAEFYLALTDNNILSVRHSGDELMIILGKEASTVEGKALFSRLRAEM